MGNTGPATVQLIRAGPSSEQNAGMLTIEKLVGINVQTLMFLATLGPLFLIDTNRDTSLPPQTVAFDNEIERPGLGQESTWREELPCAPVCPNKMVEDANNADVV